MLLSIIIPVYNVEDYIVSCIESVYNQALDDKDFEIIIIDDGCTDESIMRIAKFRNWHNNLFVFSQKQLGPSVARNLGMSKAKGKYIMFVDSDDVLVPNSLPLLLKCAFNQDSDMLFADFIEMDDKDVCGEKILSINCMSKELHMWNGNSDDFLMTIFDLNFYVWRIIYKKDFLDSKKLTFVPGILFEDILFTSQCIVHSKRCIKINKLFYVYRRRQNSIVHSVSVDGMLNINEVFARITEMQRSEQMSCKMKKGLTDIRFEVFTILLWYVISIPHLYHQRTVIINDLRKRVHDISFNNTIKQRIITFLFNMMPIKYIEMRKLLDNVIKKLKC